MSVPGFGLYMAMKHTPENPVDFLECLLRALPFPIQTV